MTRENEKKRELTTDEKIFTVGLILAVVPGVMGIIALSLFSLKLGLIALGVLTFFLGIVLMAIATQ